MAILKLVLTAWICSICAEAGDDGSSYKRCKLPKVYTECATSCPDTCDTIGLSEPRACILGCRRGVNCVCPKGYVEISEWDSTCVKTSNCPCQLPKDPGPCEALMPMYFFNAVSGKCELFNYGGCQGNANRFQTLKDCKASCSVCKLDKDPGPCKAAIKRYYYNKQTADCEIFLYGGCLGNANNFITRSACRKACVDPCILMFCPQNTVCRDGECIDPCTLVDCAKGTVCRNGKCVDPCTFTTCPIGTTCSGGDCVDPCTLIDCAEGTVCRNGQCVDPCIFTTCVAGTTCKGGKCINICKPPKVYQQCPTSCPDTCDNIALPGPRPCILACRLDVNCVCPDGYVETSTWDSTCVKKTDCPCNLPMEIGQCKGAFLKYFYNQKTGDCQQFTYGGCKGNANNFDTLSACRKTCADPCILMNCGPDRTCKDGECVDSCYPTICSYGTVCKNGKCVYPCGFGYCPENGVCGPYGQCFCPSPYGYRTPCGKIY